MPDRYAHALIRYFRESRTQSADDADGELLERFSARGDQHAFAALVDRHGPMVFHLCQRILRDSQRAEDAFQATFLVLCEKAESLTQSDSLASWLYTIAYRTAHKARLADARRWKHESRAPGPAPVDPLEQITLRESLDLLDRELARLPEKFRAPIVLCYLEGLTRDEAARKLGWTPALVKSRLEQARERLGARLAPRGLVLTDALAATLTPSAAPSAVPQAILDSTVHAATACVTATANAVVSPEVMALTQGVIKDMLLTKFKLFVPLMLALCAAGLGILGAYSSASPAALGQPGAGKSVASAAPEVDPEINKLLKLRRDTLQEAANVRKAEFTAGRVTVDVLQEAWRSLLRAELDMAATPAERVAAHLTYYKLACQIEEVCTSRHSAGQISRADHLAARAERYAAEIGLRRAGGKPPKDPKPPTDPAGRP